MLRGQEGRKAPLAKTVIVNHCAFKKSACVPQVFGAQCLNIAEKIVPSSVALFLGQLSSRNTLSVAPPAEKEQIMHFYRLLL